MGSSLPRLRDSVFRLNDIAEATDLSKETINNRIKRGQVRLYSDDLASQVTGWRPFTFGDGVILAVMSALMDRGLETKIAGQFAREAADQIGANTASIAYLRNPKHRHLMRVFFKATGPRFLIWRGPLNEAALTEVGADSEGEFDGEVIIHVWRMIDRLIERMNVCDVEDLIAESRKK